MTHFQQISSKVILGKIISNYFVLSVRLLTAHLYHRHLRVADVQLSFDKYCAWLCLRFE